MGICNLEWLSQEPAEHEYQMQFGLHREAEPFWLEIIEFGIKKAEFFVEHIQNPPESILIVEGCIELPYQPCYYHAWHSYCQKIIILE